ncbi:molybdopterin molybdotransferase MoeA [Candidatus Acetothermia bacterium]|nr:molybdopterin molybdotransferase MoeA [Candidatus Acetothermia bacterium]
MKNFFESAKPFHAALILAQSKIQPITETQEVPTVDVLGRVLASEIVSPKDLPGFARSGMDGYAVHSLDTQGASSQRPIELKVMGRAEMGQDPASLPKLENGQAMEIGTGGPLPPGADAIVILEETERISDSRVKIFSSISTGIHVIVPDEDFKKGEQIYMTGHRIRPVDIGALLALGYTRVNVFRRLKVGVISTGDELVPAETQPKPGQIREINSHILKAQLTELGAQAQLFGIVRDDRSALLKTVQRALDETDFVLLSGGSSVGAKDLTEQVLGELGQIYIHGLHMKPGKPTIFALCSNKPVVGLPGNPVSSAVVFAKFVAPLIMKSAGALTSLALRRERGTLHEEIKSVRGRTDFVPVVLHFEGESPQIERVKGHTTNISTLAKAEGLLYIEPDSEGFSQGDVVWFEIW